MSVVQPGNRSPILRPLVLICAARSPLQATLRLGAVRAGDVVEAEGGVGVPVVSRKARSGTDRIDSKKMSFGAGLLEDGSDRFIAGDTTVAIPFQGAAR